MTPKEQADLVAYHTDINAARKKAIKEYVARLKEGQPAPVLVVSAK